MRNIKEMTQPKTKFSKRRISLVKNIISRAEEKKAIVIRSSQCIYELHGDLELRGSIFPSSPIFNNFIRINRTNYYFCLLITYFIILIYLGII